MDAERQDLRAKLVVTESESERLAADSAALAAAQTEAGRLTRALEETRALLQVERARVAAAEEERSAVVARLRDFSGEIDKLRSEVLKLEAERLEEGARYDPELPQKLQRTEVQLREAQLQLQQTAQDRQGLLRQSEELRSKCAALQGECESQKLLLEAGRTEIELLNRQVEAERRTHAEFVELRVVVGRLESQLTASIDREEALEGEMKLQRASLEAENNELRSALQVGSDRIDRLFFYAYLLLFFFCTDREIILHVAFNQVPRNPFLSTRKPAGGARPAVPHAAAAPGGGAATAAAVHCAGGPAAVHAERAGCSAGGGP